jgi:hydrogenase maturation protease
MSTIVLGIGNTLLTDDGVGIYVVREMKEKVNRPDIDFVESPVAGFRLLDLMQSYDRAVIIDAIKTGGAPVGTIHKFAISDLRDTVHMTSVHDLNLATVLGLAEEMAIKMPTDIQIYAIEAGDTFTFGESLTPELVAHIPRIAEEIAKHLRTLISPLAPSPQLE